jgi:hypothetical protein
MSLGKSWKFKMGYYFAIISNNKVNNNRQKVDIKEK